MMPGRLGTAAAAENLMWMSWCDSNWIPMLNPATVMDYFSEKSNPFYDRTCNNETIKMQRLNLDQLNNMEGMEYILLHVQDPILYVIRKQHRHSPTEATPMADYYIIAGTIYQAPDLASVFNMRLLALVNNLQGAFEESSGYARYHPSKGYSWDFSGNKALSDKSKSTKKEGTAKEEPGSAFQRHRVDLLLGELIKKFPIPQIPTTTVKKEDSDSAGNGTGGGDEKSANGQGSDGATAANIKQEKNDGWQAEKKMKFN